MISENKYNYEQEDIDRIRMRCEELLDLDFAILSASTMDDANRLMEEQKAVAMEIAQVTSRALFPEKYKAKFDFIAQHGEVQKEN